MKAEADRADQAGAEGTGRNPGEAVARAEADVATRTRTKAGVLSLGLFRRRSLTVICGRRRTISRIGRPGGGMREGELKREVGGRAPRPR
jgi:hypothetical protein